MITVVLAAGVVLFLGIAVLAWGDVTGFFADPARSAAVLVSVALTVVAARSEVHFGRGKRADLGNVWFFGIAAIGSVLFAWLPPYLDRRDVWTIDGGAVRWTGVVLLVVGGVLRVWPMFVLGRRFSAFVAIQEGHTLVTDGLYRHVRHPSYLGMLLAFLGWALVFRSGVGVLLFVGAVPMTIARIDDEEALLASEFGSEWAAYRARTRRLVPGIY